MLSSVELAHHSLILLLYCSCLSSFIFVIVCDLFEGRHVFLSCVFICIAVGNSVIKRGGLESHQPV